MLRTGFPVAAASCMRSARWWSCDASASGFVEGPPAACACISTRHCAIAISSSASRPGANGFSWTHSDPSSSPRRWCPSRLPPCPVSTRVMSAHVGVVASSSQLTCSSTISPRSPRTRSRLRRIHEKYCRSEKS
ncbi:hypothetical protein BC477_10345 [Clavibacter michiganensis subsp. michiganensis]|uniref:Uncharacterized protein n=1 Tax=Clavibacter michiganensis subsp. michiganensis TaxID=33013 RepID=A0A251XPZ3_CLAMM|nr:hypothetical protein BC477_10345 [Clavibacter michiganensis subsp. michiganensis]OUE05128.1 hypothetical protein CMMCAS07_09265 [Clavibacter michiganensis subsp. michiganensis]